MAMPPVPGDVSLHGLCFSSSSQAIGSARSLSVATIATEAGSVATTRIARRCGIRRLDL